MPGGTALHERREAVKSRLCPTCAAAPGARCVDNHTRSHKARWQAYFAEKKHERGD